MKHYLSLVKVFMKMVSMPTSKDKRRKYVYGFLGAISVIGLLIPVTVGIGFVVYEMTKRLAEVGAGTLGIGLALFFICIFTLIFGFNVILNEFYFSNDIEYILPLPIRLNELLAAKFTVAFLTENTMQILVVFGAIIGFFIGAKSSFISVIYGIIGGITLPIIPLLYCGIFSLILMTGSRFLKDKDSIHKWTGVAVFILVLICIGSVGFLKGVDIFSFAEKLIEGRDKFFTVLKFVFPHVHFFIKAMETENLLYMLLYVGIHVIWFGIFLFLAGLLYEKGVMGLQGASGRHRERTLEVMLKASVKRSQLFAYCKKELLVLLRTPVFFMNCVMVNFIWPVFVIGMIQVQENPLTIARLRELYAQNDLRVQLIMLLMVIGISMINAGINSIGSNGFSREGNHFAFIKYIPMDYFLQWNAKAVVGIAVTTVSMVGYFIIAGIILRISALHIIFASILSILSISFVTYLGLLLDSMHPKLVWDDEMSVLRENFNSFFSMGIAMLVAGVLCVGGYVLFCVTEISVKALGMLLLIALIILNLVVLILTEKNGVKQLREWEEI